MNTKKVITLILFLSTTTAVIILSCGWKTINAAGGVQQSFSSNNANFPQPILVKDIDSTTPSSSIDCPIALDELMLCSAYDFIFGWELWRSDGTEDGAWFVKDLVIGEESSLALRRGSAYERINDDVYIGINKEEYLGALWKTDGSTDGTILIKEGFSYFGGNRDEPFAKLGNLLIFVAAADGFGEELWRSDGTEEGTKMLTDDGSVDFSRGFRNLTPLGEKIYFIGNEYTSELWVSDGTKSGTSLLVDSTNPEMVGRVSEMVALNDKLILWKWVTGFGSSLWQSDGSNAEPTLISDIGGENGPNVRDIVALDNQVLFTHYLDGENIWGVGITDGTQEGTTYFDIASANFSRYDLIAADSQAFLKNIKYPEITTTLWRTDGTTAGTYPLKTFKGWDSSYCRADFYAVVGSTLYFAANDGEYGCELWKSDGSIVGTIMVSDIVPGGQSSYPAPGVYFDGYLYFSATDRFGDRELWKTDGTTNGTVLADDVLDSPTLSSSPDKLIAHPTGVYFSASQSKYWSLWESDGSESGTRQIKSFGSVESEFVDKPTIFGTWQDWVTIGEILYFKVIDRNTWSGFDLWRSDGTEAGTNIVTGSPECANNEVQEVVADNLYFFSREWLCKAEIQSSKIASLDYYEYDSTKMVPGESLLFFASDKRIGVSDGSTAGTRQFDNPYVSPWFTDSNSNNMAAIDDTLLFSGCADPFEKCELWRQKDLTGEPELIQDIYPGRNSSNPSILVEGDDVVFFRAMVGHTNDFDQSPIYELWKSDGTSEGTQSIADVYVCNAGTYSAGRLVFPGYDRGYGVTDCELWISDGTESGTHILKDIVPGYGTASPEKFTSGNGYVFFTADDGLHGRELFVTNGTEEGTFLVSDILPGQESSDPERLTVSVNTLFFTAKDEEHGRELWALDLKKLPVVAKFSAEPTRGVPDLIVNFKNFSIGGFDVCTWDFGDGDIVDSCDNQTHKYNNRGTFTVSLTVNGSGGDDTMTKTDYITIGELPSADFSASPERGTPPLTVEFFNLSTGDFDQCIWDFGDNATAALCDNPKHEYKNEGQYTVGLTVKGQGGESTKRVEDCVNVANYRFYLPGVLRKN